MAEPDSNHHSDRKAQGQNPNLNETGPVSTHLEDQYSPQVKHDLEKGDKEIARLGCQVSDQAEKINQLKVLIANKDKEIEQWKLLHDQRMKNVEKLDAEASAYTKQLGDADRHIKDLGCKVSEQYNEMEKLKAKLSSEKDENKSLKAITTEQELEINRLKDERDRLKKANDDLRTRLSAHAAEKLNENNPYVEDLGDPHRPTALKERWDQIVNNGEYWMAFSDILSAAGDDCKTSNILYRVLQMAYKVACDIVEDFRQKFTETIMTAWSSDSIKQINNSEDTILKVVQLKLLKYNGEWNLIENDLLELAWFCSEQCRSNEEKPSRIPGAVDKLVVAFLKAKGPFPNAEKKLSAEIEGDSEMSNYKKELSILAAKVLDLFYYMRAQTIPLVVDFSYHEGSTFDPCLFQVDNENVKDDAGPVIQYVVFPPVLRCLQGGVLLKGEAVLKYLSKKALQADKEVQTDGEGEMVDASLPSSSNTQQEDNKKFPKPDGSRNNAEREHDPSSNVKSPAHLDDTLKSGADENRNSTQNNIETFTEFAACVQKVTNIPCTTGSHGIQSSNDYSLTTTDDSNGVQNQNNDQGEVPSTEKELQGNDNDKENGKSPKSSLPGMKMATAGIINNGVPNLETTSYDKSSSENGDQHTNNCLSKHVADSEYESFEVISTEETTSQIATTK